MAEESSSEKYVEKIVLSYLNKKGYKETEAILRKESKTESIGNLEKGLTNLDDNQLAKLIITGDAPNQQGYERGYVKLRRWIEDSIDLYKSELHSVLYPIFIHIYLDLVLKGVADQARQFYDTHKGDHLEHHHNDMKLLAGVVEPQHVEENAFATMFRENKYSLRMSGASFELLLFFLQDNKIMPVLKIVNQHLNIVELVTSESPAKRQKLEDNVIGITGHDISQLDKFNSLKANFGSIGIHIRADTVPMIEKRLQTRENKEAGEELARIKQSIPSDMPDPDRIPLPPMKSAEVEARIQELEDLSKQLALGPAALPSICFYTFHNTQNTFNNIHISDDCNLICAGTSDSIINVWSLKGEKLHGLKSDVIPAEVKNPSDEGKLREENGSYQKKLVGHTGPIFGAKISSDNKYLVSCSEDGSARLWSLDTFTDFVVYKGHNYPIWDIDFGPEGFYFATASHDRTARLWSCDHIHPLRIFAGHLSDVDSIRFHPNCNYIATGSSDKTCRFWDIQTGNSIRVFTGHTGSIYSLAFSRDGKLLATAGEDKDVILWDLVSGKKAFRFKGHTNSVHCMDFSRENNILATGGADRCVRIWDIRKLESLSNPTGTDSNSNPGLLGAYFTKQTGVYHLQFTRRNILVAAGCFNPQQESVL